MAIFATNAVKVKDAYYMWLQIDTFRQKGSGNWLDLLEATAKDPAMLIWLDQAQAAGSIRTKILPVNAWSCSPWAKVITRKKM